jgi:predicted  nucleic acid-binding Zn-ribbon protein
MTDTTASSASPEHGDNTPLHQPEKPGPQPSADNTSGWEEVTLPGQLPLAVISTSADEAVVEKRDRQEHDGNDALPVADGTADATTIEPDLSSPEPAPEDLVQLIQDLNQCNDALLLRVTELEDELERSQLALQAEVERNQVAATGLPTATPPGPVQQQIAQLLSELDIANDGLRRTTIHNETIHAELETSQQRVAQLERECTLLQQRFSDKTTALQQAEETCRDLKARLHRQQRYTLQFKAALEKCLNTAPGSTGVGAINTAAPVAREEGQPVTMPRSQQIQPWSGGPGALGDNPSLTQLLRGLRGPGSATTAAEPQQPPLSTPPKVGDAVANLPGVAAQAAPVPLSPPQEPPAPPAAPDPWLEAPPAAAVEQATLFTEPSPWGEPVMPVPTAPREVTPIQPAEIPSAVEPIAPPPEPQTPVAPAPRATAPVAPALPSYLMGNTATKSSPSPLVYPLRSQKKITSIAAVELPSFGRPRRR